MRSIRFDIVRILACLMIVIMHSPLPSGPENGLFLSSLSYLTAPGVGLFFMLSGALVLPVATKTVIFLKRRFVKIAVPVFIWTVLYLIAGILIKGNPFSLKEILSIPFSAQGNPTFWFLYTLIGLYLLAPIISKWLISTSRKELVFYLCLWSISLCYPLLSKVFSINTSDTGILYYFSGYVGYFVLGYFLRRYRNQIKVRWIVPAALIAYVAPVVCKVVPIRIDFYSVFWYLSIFVVVQCIFIWLLVDRFVPEHGNKVCSMVAEWLSRNTFGVYLVHFFVIRYILWEIPFIKAMRPYSLQTVLIVILAVFVSLAATSLIRFLPGSKYLIGGTPSIRAR